MIVGLLLAAAASLAGFGPDAVGPLSRQDAVAALAAFAGCVAVTLWAARRLATHGRETAAILLVWCAGIVGTAQLFAEREQLGDAVRALSDETGEVETQSAGTAGLEVTIRRRHDGSFVVLAEVNGRAARFIFDTGATTVVLTSEAASSLVLDVRPLAFRIPVTTANGSGLAAPVTLDRLAVGGLVLRRVPALVTQPGALRENLLGLSFLDRLGSYEVRGDRLVLRGRTG